MDRNVVAAIYDDCRRRNKDYLFRHYTRIPSVLYNRVPAHNDIGDTFYREFRLIQLYYEAYKAGVDFVPDACRGDYLAAHLEFKKIAQIINKQARFLFGVRPDIKLELAIDLGEEAEETQKSISLMQEVLDKVLEKAEFENKIYKAAKDSMIGKRVAAVVNFDTVNNNLTIDFLSAFYFVYRQNRHDATRLDYFMCFKVLIDADKSNDIRILRKIYDMRTVQQTQEQIDGGEPLQEHCYVTEEVFDGGANNVSSDYDDLLTDYDTGLTTIPAVVFANDGLTDETRGISEVDELMDFEHMVNFLNCMDIDAQRTSAFPMKYSMDVDPSTSGQINNRIGHYADLVTDDNRGTSQQGKLGLLEAQLNYSTALQDVLKRISKAMHDLQDVPDIDLETMSGVITSGKALKALYWGLSARCDEKMKVWAPGIQNLVEIIFEGLFAFPALMAKYLNSNVPPLSIDFATKVERNSPLPDDEDDEKQIDMQEVTAGVRSRSSYIQKWSDMNETQAAREVIQIVLEESLYNDASINPNELDGNELARLLAEDYGLDMGATAGDSTASLTQNEPSESQIDPDEIDGNNI